MTAQFFCSDLARSENEQLIGTAKPIRLFIALEYPGPWSPKAAASPDFPAEVREFIGLARGRVPEFRFLAIRQPESKHRQPSCYVCLPDRSGSPLYHWRLRDYRDILSIPLAEIAEGKTEGLDRAERPLFLVCTHGKHDKCCARNGNPVWNGVQEIEDAWESSHVGGCRFAANMLCLPRGLVFGMLGAADARRVIEAYRGGKLDLANFRGRCAYPKPVQAAEYFLRKHLSIDGIDDLQLERTETASGGSSITRFLCRDGFRYEVAHAVSRSPDPRILACGDTEPEYVWTHLQSDPIRRL